MYKIFIATTTFGQYSNEPIDFIRSNNCKIDINKYGRKLKKEEYLNIISKYDGVLAGTELYDKDIINKATKLKTISRLGVGMDNIDMKYAKQKSIDVCSTTTSPALAVSELTLGLIIDLLRKITLQRKKLCDGIWSKEMGKLLSRKTLGIVGMGAVGKSLLQLVKGFNLSILAYDIVCDNDYAKANNFEYVSLDKLLKNSDVISIHLSLSNETSNLIDMKKIKIIKPDSILINTSRGEICDEESLIWALENNKLSGIGLDVFKDEPYNGPLIKYENAILTPHVGSYAREIRTQMEIEAAKNLIKGLNK